MRLDQPIILKKKKVEDESKVRENKEEDVQIRFVSKGTGDAIKEAREKLGYTQKELSHKMNKNAVVVSSWETGKAVYEKKIAELFEKVLGIKFT